jgi:hypothetical protein
VHNQRSFLSELVMGVLVPGGEGRAGRSVAREASLMARSAEMWLRGAPAAGSVRETLLTTIKNPRLRRLVAELYRAAAKYGDGGTADAIRHTKWTGELIAAATTS